MAEATTLDRAPHEGAQTGTGGKSAEPMVKVRNLKMHFPVTEGAFIPRVVAHVKAVDGISFDITKGETLGLVGESGCGKTTTGRCILQLETPTDGEIFYDGRDLTKLSKEELRPMRQRIQVIFQDPYSSLNPRMTIGQIISEPMMVHNIITDEQGRRNRVLELLSTVGLNPRFADRYPHEMSGGQRQRVGIARALAVNPEFIICDEAVYRQTHHHFAYLELDRLKTNKNPAPLSIFALVGNPFIKSSKSYRSLDEAHRELLSAYRAGDWAAARASLEQVKKSPGAAIALFDIYEKRIAEMADKETPAGWDGAHVVTL